VATPCSVCPPAGGPGFFCLGDYYIIYIIRARAEHASAPLRSRTRTTHWWQPPALVFFCERSFSCCACALQKKHGICSHSPRKGQRPRSSCLAADYYFFLVYAPMSMPTPTTAPPSTASNLERGIFVLYLHPAPPWRRWVLHLRPGSTPALAPPSPWVPSTPGSTPRPTTQKIIPAPRPTTAVRQRPTKEFQY
jgi:hypothetical protein